MAGSPFDLTGRVALITGGAQGLGESIAELFALHGAQVALADIHWEQVAATAERLAVTCDAEVEAFACDVRDNENVLRCVDAVLDRFTQIDVLVNNAGIHRRVDPLDWDAGDVAAIIEVNLHGCFQMASAVGRQMVDRRSGSIINMSALGGGVIGLGRSGSAYGMTKGAIVSLTRDLAAEWGRYGVRVNALAPGWIRTPMTTALQENEARAATMLERVPLGRWGEPADVAAAALFLASEAASYITGLTIPGDGGAANVIAFP